MIAARIQSDGLTDLLGRAEKLGKGGDAALVGGRGVRQLLVDHFASLDASRANTMGGQRSHFYAQVAKATTVPKLIGKSSVVISINKVGFAQRLLGGEIRPGKGTSSSSGKPTKFLAIPARAEAYGKSPGEFSDLEFRPFKGRKGGMLVEVTLTRIAGKNGKILKNPAKGAADRTQGGMVMFWLVESVNQKPDPTVLPTEAQMTTKAETEVSGYVDRLMAS